METIGIRPMDFEPKEGEITLRSNSFKKRSCSDFYKPEKLDEVITEEESNTCLKKRKVSNLKLQTTFSFQYLVPEKLHLEGIKCAEELFSNQRIKPETIPWFSPKSIGELEVAATKVQKVYKSYRTRRNLADCAVVCEELWYVLLYYQTFLMHLSLIFYESFLLHRFFNKKIKFAVQFFISIVLSLY